jgi:hypothetical protein
MKKTIWLPPLTGLVFGGLAGAATITGLSFLVESPDTSSAIGFFMTLLLLAAAFGGPLAGIIAPAVFVTLSWWHGPADMKAVLSEPAVFWTNTVVLGVLCAGVALAYRRIFERGRMPGRLLPWAGVVLVLYLLTSPINITLQWLLVEGVEPLPAILFSYRAYWPQALFDIFVTSLIFVALPERYRRPWWYTPMRAPEPGGPPAEAIP